MTLAPGHDELLARAFDLAEALVAAVSAVDQDWRLVERDVRALGDVAGEIAKLAAGGEGP